MTPRQRRVRLYGALAVVVALCLWALARGVPTWKQIRGLRADREALRDEAVSLAKRTRASIAALEDELGELAGQRQTLLDTEIPRASAAQLDAAMTHLAERHGLVVEATEAREPGARDVATTVTHTGTGDDGYAGVRPTRSGWRGSAAAGRRITLRGPFGSLRAFLSGLAELPAPPVVTRLAMTHALEDARGGLRMELEIAQ